MRGKADRPMTHMNPRRRTADGLVIRYAEAGRAGDETVLLLNPWPESLFAWDTIWSRLAQSARLVAIDLPGFGRSEGRAELLSPRAMGQFLVELVDEWRLDRPHLVGPDVGTGAVLFALSEDGDRFPRISGRERLSKFPHFLAVNGNDDVALGPESGFGGRAAGDHLAHHHTGCNIVAAGGANERSGVIDPKTQNRLRAAQTERQQ